MSTRFALGITGHRPGKLNPDGLPQIRAALRDVFIAAADQMAPRPMALVSSIAEGADTMAAEEALALGWALVSPLPFPADDYAKDFAQGAKRETFRRLLAAAESSVCTAGRAVLADEAEGYRAASHAMLDASQALVVVWNSEPTHLIGGAYDTLMTALDRDMPVLWIPASGAGFPVALKRAHRACLSLGEVPADAGGEDDFLARLG